MNIYDFWEVNIVQDSRAMTKSDPHHILKSIGTKT